MATVSSNDQLVDLFIERAIDLLRLEAGTKNKVLTILNDLEGELIGALAKIDPSGVGGVSAQQKRLRKLLDQVQSSIKAGYRNANTLMSSEIREIADQESTWLMHAVNKSVDFELVTGGLTRQSLATLSSNILIQGAASADWWSRQAQDLQNRFADQMRLGISAGETNADLVTRVRGKADQPGIMDVSRNSATRLVRSSVQTAANAAREETYKQNDDIIADLQWHATLDTRTSIWCITRDGHHYSNDSEHKPVEEGSPPWLQGPGKLHWQCRSTSVPRLKSWRDLGIDMDEVPQTTRASMDGQVAAKQTFEEWLNKQSTTRQDTVLGKGKADLWRAGKIKFRDLLDQNGRPLTTEQLREKAARANQNK